MMNKKIELLLRRRTREQMNSVPLQRRPRTSVGIILVLIVAILLSRDEVEGFCSGSQARIMTTVPNTRTTIAVMCPSRRRSSATRTRTSVSLARKGGNKNKKVDEEETADSADATASSWWTTFQQKPANLILLPFVGILGVDLVLNIVFLVKRTLEYVVFGQVPSTETWFSQ